MLVDLTEREITLIRGDVHKHVIPQDENLYTEWNVIAYKLDAALGVVEVSDDD